jgi:hypothetical protein
MRTPGGNAGGSALALGLFAFAPAACAQLFVPGDGKGTVGVVMQTVTDHYHYNWRGDEIDAGKITANSLMLRFDYGLTDRLAVSATLPYIDKKYEGARPHTDPFDPPHGHDEPHDELELLDDGNFHGHWQDWGVGIRYRWKDAPLAITPFLNYSWPSHDYTFYAHAAPGTQQTRTQLGLFVGRQFGPPWINNYLQGYYSYTVVEKVLGIGVNYSTLNLEFGHFFSERLGGRVFATYRKTHGGLDFPIDFPMRGNPAYDPELLLHHDQTQRVDYLNAGLGLSWSLGERYTLSGEWMSTFWGENGHKIHNAVTIGLYRSF